MPPSPEKLQEWQVFDFLAGEEEARITRQQIAVPVVALENAGKLRSDGDHGQAEDKVSYQHSPQLYPFGDLKSPTEKQAIESTRQHDPRQHICLSCLRHAYEPYFGGIIGRKCVSSQREGEE